MTFAQRISFAGKSVLVTGGSKGIGAAMCRGFSEAGARVIVADIDAKAGHDLANELGGQFTQFDVTDTDACVELAKAVPVDVVVANAGIVHNAPSAKVDIADFQSVIDVNLVGVFNTLQAFGAKMIERQRGAIVCTSSICGEVSVWPQPQAAYNAAKAGVNLLVKSTAVELSLIHISEPTRPY